MAPKSLLYLAVMLTAITLLPFVSARPRTQSPADDYKIISSMSTLKERKAFFSSLTPERKSAIWRHQLAVALIEHPELSTNQKQVIGLAKALANVEVFRDKPAGLCEKGSPFSESLSAAFKDNPGLRSEIFGRLGGPLLSAKRAHAQDPVGGGGSGGGVPECGCNNESLCDACWPQGCQMWPCRRTGGPDGCGCFWLLPCNQLCG